jgi:hypothetical protein
METSQLQIIWASKPDCTRPVAEFWIGEYDLWFTMFVDDCSRLVMVEVLPPAIERTTQILDFKQLERLMEQAKRELVAMAASPG